MNSVTMNWYIPNQKHKKKFLREYKILIYYLQYASINFDRSKPTVIQYTHKPTVIFIFYFLEITMPRPTCKKLYHKTLHASKCYLIEFWLWSVNANYTYMFFLVGNVYMFNQMTMKRTRHSYVSFQYFSNSSKQVIVKSMLYILGLV